MDCPSFEFGNILGKTAGPKMDEACGASNLTILDATFLAILQGLSALTEAYHGL
jgi:hypothetical protein